MPKIHPITLSIAFLEFIFVLSLSFLIKVFSGFDDIAIVVATYFFCRYVLKISAIGYLNEAIEKNPAAISSYILLLGVKKRLSKINKEKV